MQRFQSARQCPHASDRCTKHLIVQLCAWAGGLRTRPGSGTRDIRGDRSGVWWEERLRRSRDKTGLGVCRELGRTRFGAKRTAK